MNVMYRVRLESFISEMRDFLDEVERERDPRELAVLACRGHGIMADLDHIAGDETARRLIRSIGIIPTEARI